MFGLLLAGAWFFGNNPSLMLFSSSPLTTSTGKELPVSGAISVVNQPAGDTVVVESVTVPATGVWAAVHEVQGNDLGNVLGAARVSGAHSNFSIPLLRATQPDRSYAIQLYRDDADGTFDPAKNSVYVDFDTGARVVSYFKTSP